MAKRRGNPLELTVERQLGHLAPPEAFDAIRGWLVKEQAAFLEQDRPTLIVAKHGRRLQPKGWAKDGRKRLKFTIAPRGEGCVVTAVVRPTGLNAGDVQLMLNETHGNWRELLEDLWATVGSVGGRSGYARVAPIDWESVLKSARARARRGKLGTIIGFVLVVGAMALVARLGVDLQGGTATAVMGGPGLILTWTAMDWILGGMRAREAKRALKERVR